MRMWTRRCLLVTLGMAALAGCTGGSGYTGIGSETRFYADDWIYYDDDDEYFLAGLTDEEKEALKREWDSLSPRRDNRFMTGGTISATMSVRACAKHGATWTPPSGSRYSRAWTLAPVTGRCGPWSPFRQDPMAAQSGTVPGPALVRFVLAASVEVAEPADVVASAEVAG